MPTIASNSTVMHLYGPPRTGVKDGKTWASFNGWTADKVRPQGGGEAEKKFTSWQGFISGPQAEWLVRDGVKGSLVYVSGTIRADLYEKDGTSHARIEFTRVNECRILDRKEDDAAERTAPAPARPIIPSGAPGDSDPPFHRSELEMLP